MSLKKQAKTLSRAQVDALIAYLATTRQPTRNRLIFLLSVRAGLRAKEIAGLTWSMVTDSNGAVAADIALVDKASKGCSGRTIPISKELRAAFEAWKVSRDMENCPLGATRNCPLLG